MIELKVHAAGLRDLREPAGIFLKFGGELRFVGAVPPELWPRSKMQLVSA